MPPPPHLRGRVIGEALAKVRRRRCGQSDAQRRQTRGRIIAKATARAIAVRMDMGRKNEGPKPLGKIFNYYKSVNIFLSSSTFLKKLKK